MDDGLDLLAALPASLVNSSAKPNVPVLMMMMTKLPDISAEDLVYD